MRKYKLIAIVGKAGSGKDRVLREIMETKKDYFHKVIQFTTRPPREGEKQGEAYYFVDNKVFKEMSCMDCMIESAEYRNWFYGTAYSSLNEAKINIGVFNLKALKQIQENENIELMIVHIDTEDKTRLLRQLNREKHPDCQEIVRRFAADDKEFFEFEKKGWSSFKNENKIQLWLIKRYILRFARSWAKTIN